jgi:hypothetical protein
VHAPRLFSAALLVLGLTLAAVPVQADPERGKAARNDRTPRVLAQAEKVFDEDIDPTAAPDDATLVLRRLARSLDDLRDEDRERAARMLARPDDKGGDLLGVKYKARSEHVCGPEVCVHFVRSTSDAPPHPGEAVPPQVELTVDVFSQVWAALVDGAGYRAPLPDRDSKNAGPDERLDVYLADIGSIGAGYYGFCNSDDPEATEGTHPQVSAYCVLDDDFSTSQFGGDPLDSLRVTAAHEFFHAVQFAYDYWEDLWFMEGTAAWAEELVFDDANDNHRYLGGSQLSRPWIPLDNTDGNAAYGSWIYWQFLTELFGDDVLPDPTVIRHIWSRAEGDTPSMQALRATLAERGTTFEETYALFGTVNLAPETFYEEGSTFGASVPMTRGLKFFEDRQQRRTTAVLDHFSTDYYRFVADAELDGRRALRVRVDMPDRDTGSAATLVADRGFGLTVTKPIKLRADGVGSARVNFTRGLVKAVYLVLSNAGRADGQETRIKGKVLRVTR